MGNLSAFIPTESATVQAIYAWRKKLGDAEPQRGYLGASIVGHECDRYLWFTFRNCIQRQFDGRMYRLFNTGHREEERFVQELQGIGCAVHAVNEDGKQFEVKAVAGHFSGHADAVALGLPEAPKTWHLCEFKTHNDKSFNNLKANGVQKSKPMHYTQMQVYMGLMKLDRALYLAVNKDTDELYAERIEYSSKECKAILSRAERIIKSTQPCERCASRPDDFRCKFCDAAELCWGRGMALPSIAHNCRTCCHATPEMDGDGRWSCAAGGKFGEVCDKHLVIPTILQGCEPVDGGDGFIEFKNSDGKTWRHGVGYITTADLTKLPVNVLPATLQAKATLQGAVEGFEVPVLSLIERYNPRDSRLLWEGVPGDFNEAKENEIIGGLEETDEFEDENHHAVEYGGKICAVHYKPDNYCAVWGGVE